MKSKVSDLFKEEIEALNHAELLCRDKRYKDSALMVHYEKLVSMYDKNLKFMMKLTKISDSQQKYLQQVQEELKREIEIREKIEASLRNSNEVIHTVLDNLNALVFVIEEASSNIIFVNKYAKTVLSIESQADMNTYMNTDFYEEIIKYHEDIWASSNIEWKSSSGDRWYSINSTKIDWVDGKKVFLQVGMDITERKLSEEQLKVYAYTDAVTGVLNRRTGLMILEREIETMLRTHMPLVICYIDIDDLKKVNDEYGHTEGDYVIKTVADIIKRSVRKTDTLSRIGGDEFLLILPNCKKYYVHGVIDNINNKLKDLCRHLSKPYNISFSIGIKEITPDNKLSSEELIKIIDKEMYQNKATRKR